MLCTFTQLQEFNAPTSVMAHPMHLPGTLSKIAAAVRTSNYNVIYDASDISSVTNSFPDSTSGATGGPYTPVVLSDSHYFGFSNHAANVDIVFGSVQAPLD